MVILSLNCQLSKDCLTVLSFVLWCCLADFLADKTRRNGIESLNFIAIMTLIYYSTMQTCDTVPM